VEKPLLKVSVFADYICPFCYVGYVRLMRLRAHYDLRVNWCFLEIHPETPPEGQPLSALGYPPERWELMMTNLERLAAEEGLELAPRAFTTNSRRALLLAEAAKSLGATPFYALHDAIYHAYFRDGRNIGDLEVLRELAHSSGIPAPLVESAWRDASYEEHLRQYLAMAGKAGVRGVPTYLFGERQLSGAVSLEVLKDAAADAVG